MTTGHGVGPAASNIGSNLAPSQAAGPAGLLGRFPRSRAGLRWSFDAAVATLVGLATFALYTLTLAPTVLRSDSGEFHVMPWVLGIAHAPGYVLLTLLGRVAMLLPVGDPAYRVSLLDAGAAAAAVALLYLAVVEVSRQREGNQGPDSNGRNPASSLASWPGRAGGLAAASALGLGATYWQQSVVGGPRPLIFFFVALLLWLLFRWGNRVGSARALPALLLFAASAGLALTHHPNLLMFFPAFALYLLAKDPRLLLRGRHLGPALLAFLAPLALYAYLPLRSAMGPPLGTSILTDPRELLVYVTATHYQDAVLNNCNGSRLIQVQRYLVFLTLQYGPLLPAAMALGSLLTLLAAPLAGLVLLYAFAVNATFGICSTLAMPDYVIPSYLVGAVWIGLGLAWPLRWLGRWRTLPSLAPSALVIGVTVGLVAYRLVTGLPHQSMVARTADAERARDGLRQTQPDGLVLADWESLPPIWYAQHVEGLNSAARTSLVTAAPGSDVWLIQVERALRDSLGVALAHRVPSLIDKYRQFPVSSFHEVSEKAIVDRRTDVGLLSSDRAIRLLGYRLDRTVVGPGDLVRLTLYQKTDRGAEEPYLPVIRLASEPPVEVWPSGNLRRPLPAWMDHEVVGEVFTLSIPAWAPAGELPLEIAYRIDGQDQLIGLAGGQPWAPLGSLQVTEPPIPLLGDPPGTLANLANQFVLRAGRLGREPALQLAAGPVEAARLSPGGVLDLELQWSALRWMDDSYTLFVHLLDAENRLVAQHDGLPLGGVYHTYKWVPGQVITDWYQLPLRPDLPPGEYWLEIGAYHMVTTQRLPVLDSSGNSTRESFRWGPIRVE